MPVHYTLLLLASLLLAVSSGFPGLDRVLPFLYCFRGEVLCGFPTIVFSRISLPMNVIMIDSIDDFVPHNSVDWIQVFCVILRGFSDDLGSRAKVQLRSGDIDNRVCSTILRELEFYVVRANLEDFEWSIRNWCKLCLVRFLSP